MVENHEVGTGLAFWQGPTESEGTRLATKVYERRNFSKEWTLNIFIDEGASLKSERFVANSISDRIETKGKNHESERGNVELHRFLRYLSATPQSASLRVAVL